MPLHDGRFRQPDDFLAALADGDLHRIADNFFNRLEAPARAAWPEFDAARRELAWLDCLAVRMSGSGTAFYGLCEHAEHANLAAERLRSRLGTAACVFAATNQKPL